jgi:hypothetical protein
MTRKSAIIVEIDFFYFWCLMPLSASRLHPFCNLQNRVPTHAILVVGLYELLGNPTT